LISPYAYDYDLPIAGVGFALLGEDLMALGKSWERDVIYGLTALIGGYGMLATLQVTSAGGADGAPFPAAAGLLLVLVLLLIWRIVARAGVDPARAIEAVEG
jgi:hypothetical protein